MKHTHITQEIVDNGERVECDGCSKEFTNSEESGGFLFGSYAYGPCCAAKMEKKINEYGEQSFITDRCPAGKSFWQWCLELRGGNNNTIITTIERK